MLESVVAPLSGESAGYHTKRAIRVPTVRRGRWKSDTLRGTRRGKIGTEIHAAFFLASAITFAEMSKPILLTLESTQTQGNESDPNEQ